MVDDLLGNYALFTVVIYVRMGARGVLCVVKSGFYAPIGDKLMLTNCLFVQRPSITYILLYTILITRFDRFLYNRMFLLIDFIQFFISRYNKIFLVLIEGIFLITFFKLSPFMYVDVRDSTKYRYTGGLYGERETREGKIVVICAYKKI